MAGGQPKRLNEYQQEWYARHRGTARQEREQYAEVSSDPERAAARAAYNKEYRDLNREQIRANTKKRSEADYKSKLRGMHNADWDILFEGLWSAQDGKCYLCGDPLDRDEARAIHLDHDHRCCPLGRSCERCRRGLACKVCNRLVGWVQDDFEKLRRIATNLEQALQAGR